jgi:hypothetical protein
MCVGKLQKHLCFTKYMWEVPIHNSSVLAAQLLQCSGSHDPTPVLRVLCLECVFCPIAPRMAPSWNK